MKKVSRFIRPFAGIIAVGILLKAVGSFADLFLPYLLSFIIDDGIGTQNTQLIIQMCSLMLVISLISLGSNLTGHYIASKISTLVGKNIREEVYRHIPVSYTHLKHCTDTKIPLSQTRRPLCAKRREQDTYPMFCISLSSNTLQASRHKISSFIVYDTKKKYNGLAEENENSYKGSIYAKSCWVSWMVSPKFF